MASGPTSAPEAALVPLFLGGRRCNVTFVVDSSEGARAALGSVKRLLIQTLLTKASLRDSLFNIVTFSGELTCWSHHMLPCAPDTLYMALSWIHSISCGPGGDLLGALSVALADPACHAVHLLCTDVPDRPGAVLAGLPALAAGRPVNVFYLQDSGGQLDSGTRDYLQCLTRATRGSCYVIPVGLNGVLEKVIPLYVVEKRSSAPTISPVKCRCPSTSVLMPHNTPSPPLSLGNPCTRSGQTMGGPEFYTGGRVLARREADGFYYPGTVTQQVQGRGGVWVVEFDHPGGAGLGGVSPRRQVVCSLDMANQARGRPGPGDAVLSPWEPDLRRYGPGRVMAAAAAAHINGFGAEGVSSLRVLMWNRCVSLVPGVLVLPVSAPQHDRIVRELQVQTSASSRCCSWVRTCSSSCRSSSCRSSSCSSSSCSSSCSCSSCSCSSCTPRPLCTDCCPPLSRCCSVSNHRPRSFPPSCGSGFGRAEWDKPPDLRDTDVWRSDPGVPSSSSSSSSSSEDESRVLKLRSKQPRPPWRYWRQTGPEPQHTQTGRSVPWRTCRPERFIFPVPRSGASPNHSSPFPSPPGAKGRRATDFKPRPPAGLRPSSSNNALHRTRQCANETSPERYEVKDA